VLASLTAALLLVVLGATAANATTQVVSVSSASVWSGRNVEVHVRCDDDGGCGARRGSCVHLFAVHLHARSVCAACRWSDRRLAERDDCLGCDISLFTRVFGHGREAQTVSNGGIDRLEATWVMEAAAFAAGVGSLHDLRSISVDWLALEDSPDGLFQLSDLDGSESYEEILPLVASAALGIGVVFDDSELIGLLASARWIIRWRDFGIERVVHSLSSLAIKFPYLEKDLIGATLASDAFEDGLPQAETESSSRVEMSRDAVLSHLLRSAGRAELIATISAELANAGPFRK